MFNPRHTIVRRVSAQRPEASAILEAADVLRRGRLVAFPTETVYGLGANALDAAAVESIFAAKGRPPDNPVIVHVADAAAAQQLVTTWPERAARLAERFWPGALTLVLPKRSVVPDVVTGGGSTVGIRVPAHAVALALLRAAAMPVAAPSANCSARISPTTADHVLRGLKGRIDLVLDSGPTPGGLESTVLDLTTEIPRVLRPGLVSVAELETVIGTVQAPASALRKSASAPLPAPGMLERHYAPRAELLCVTQGAEHRVDELLAEGKRVGWMRQKAEGRRQKAEGGAEKPEIRSQKEARQGGLVEIEMPGEVAAYSARLYAALHELDDAGMDAIVVDMPPDAAAWLAVRDRLARASRVLGTN